MSLRMNLVKLMRLYGNLYGLEKVNMKDQFMNGIVEKEVHGLQNRLRLLLFSISQNWG